MLCSLSCRRCGNSFESKRSDAMYCIPCRKLQSRDAALKHERDSRKPCPDCGERLITRRAQRCKPCDGKWRIERYSSGQNPNWKGGRTIDGFGYVLLRIERGRHKPGTSQYVREHRLIWEQANGPLPEKYIIHHLNGIKDDNRLANLAAMSRSDHHVRHAEPYEARIQALESALRMLWKKYGDYDSTWLEAQRVLGD